MLHFDLLRPINLVVDHCPLDDQQFFDAGYR